MTKMFKLILIYMFCVGVAFGCALIVMEPSLNTVNMLRTK